MFHCVSRRTLEFGCAIVVIGLLAGIAGFSTTLLLRAVEHLTYNYSFGTLLEGVTASGLCAERSDQRSAARSLASADGYCVAGRRCRRSRT